MTVAAAAAVVAVLPNVFETADDDRRPAAEHTLHQSITTQPSSTRPGPTQTANPLDDGRPLVWPYSDAATAEERGTSAGAYLTNAAETAIHFVRDVQGASLDAMQPQAKGDSAVVPLYRGKRQVTTVQLVRITADDGSRSMPSPGRSRQALG